MKLQHDPNTLWLEFGVASGKTINYISKFTNDTVYGFDSFEGLPEKWRNGFDKGCFNRNGNLPKVNKNVTLIKGWFDETLPNFIENKVDYEWIGMNGTPTGMSGYCHENVALIIHSIN